MTEVEASSKPDDFFVYSKRFLKLLFANPFSEPVETYSWSGKIAKFLKENYLLFLVANIVICHILITVQSFLCDRNISKGATLVVSLVFSSFEVVKSFVLKGKKHLILKLSREIDEFFTKNSQPKSALIIQKNLRLFKKIAFFEAAFYVMISFLHCISPIINFLTTGLLTLPNPTWFPFDEKNPFVFPFVYTWWFWILTGTVQVFCGVDLLLFGLIILVSLEFQILSKSLKAIDPRKERFYEKLTDFVSQHVTVTQTAKKVQELFSMIFFVGLFGMILMICNSGYSVTHKNSGADLSLKIVSTSYIVFILLNTLLL